jgi:hypothetical protein
MNKKILLKIINVILGILFLNQAITGIFHDFLPRSIFEFFHAAGFLFIITTLLHVYLNWNWVKLNLFPGNRKTGE